MIKCVRSDFIRANKILLNLVIRVMQTHFILTKSIITWGQIHSCYEVKRPVTMPTNWGNMRTSGQKWTMEWNLKHFPSPISCYCSMDLLGSVISKIPCSRIYGYFSSKNSSGSYNKSYSGIANLPTWHVQLKQAWFHRRLLDVWLYTWLYISIILTYKTCILNRIHNTIEQWHSS